MKLWSRLKIALGNLSDDRFELLKSPIEYDLKFLPTCGDADELDRIIANEIDIRENMALSSEEYYALVDKIMRAHGYNFNEFLGIQKKRVYYKDREIARAQETRT